MRDTYGYNQISLRAFEVLSPDGAHLSRLAGVGAFVIGQSSEQPAYPAANAIDYDRSSAWFTQDGQSANQWLTVRLLNGTSQRIDRVMLRGADFGPQNNIRTFQILVSDTSADNVAFTTIYTGSLPLDTVPHWFFFPEVSARYVQLRALSNYGGRSVNLSEFRIYSAWLGGAAVPFDGLASDAEGLITSWHWSFGDGTTSSEAHPLHTYARPGVYPVQLTVTDSDGRTAKVTKTYTALQATAMTVSANPVPPQEGANVAFAYQPADPVPLSSILSWQWAFDNAGQPVRSNNVTALAPTLSALLRDSGSFRLTLTITDSQLLTTQIVSDVQVLNLAPQVTIGVNQILAWGQRHAYAPTISEIGDLDRSSLRCVWDFGDGETQTIAPCTSTSAQVGHAYATPGIYITRMSVSDKDGGVSASAVSVTVTKRPTLLQAESFDATADGQGQMTLHLYDQFSGKTLGGQDLRIVGAGPAQMIRTGADGRARLTVTLPSGIQTSLSASFVETALYLGTQVTRSVTVGPDLTVTDVSRTHAPTNPQTLAISGTVAVTITNRGSAQVAQPFRLIVFEDLNRDGVYSADQDSLLGTQLVNAPLVANQPSIINVPVAGAVTFRDPPLMALVDSDTQILEVDETNNTGTCVAACTYTMPAAEAGIFAPRVEWSWIDQYDDPNATYRGVQMVPIVAPLFDSNGDGRIDGDDVPAVIFTTSGGRLVAVRGDTGAEIFVVTNPAYQVGRSARYSELAVGDIDGDGLPEIIAARAPTLGYARGTPQLIAFENDGRFKWYSDLIDIGGYKIFFGSIYLVPNLADLDSDGRPEIIVGANVLNGDGTTRWHGQNGQGEFYSAKSPFCCTSIVADLDLDGSPEIVAGQTAYRADGSIYWTHAENYRLDQFGQALPEPQAIGLAAVGNFDDDPFPEIVVTTHTYGNDPFVWLLEHNGDVKWGPVQRGIAGVGPPTIADVDGDGVPEIGVAGGYEYTVFKANGTILWSKPVRDESSAMTGSTVFDFDGDGRAEIIYADEQYLRIFRGSDGNVLFETPNSSGTLLEYPVISDIDRDGNAELLVARNNLFGYNQTVGLNEMGLFAYGDSRDSWVTTRGIWNQYAYHITNVNDDATIPAHEAPSWLTHNTYRSNLPSGGQSPQSTPDLTIGKLTLDTSAFPGAVTITARVGNGGAVRVTAGAQVSLYEDVLGSGQQILTVVSIPTALDPGQYVDVPMTSAITADGFYAFIAAVDDNGTGISMIRECDEANKVYDNDSRQTGPFVIMLLHVPHSSGVPGASGAFWVWRSGQEPPCARCCSWGHESTVGSETIGTSSFAREIQICRGEDTHTMWRHRQEYMGWLAREGDLSGKVQQPPHSLLPPPAPRLPGSTSRIQDSPSGSAATADQLRAARP